MPALQTRSLPVHPLQHTQPEGARHAASVKFEETPEQSKGSGLPGF